MIKELINKYNLNLIAIGNGTASRESEELVASICKDLKAFFPLIIVLIFTDIQYIYSYSCSSCYSCSIFKLFLFLRLKNENIFYSF